MWHLTFGTVNYDFEWPEELDPGIFSRNELEINGMAELCDDLDNALRFHAAAYRAGETINLGSFARATQCDEYVDETTAALKSSAFKNLGQFLKLVSKRCAVRLKDFAKDKSKKDLVKRLKKMKKAAEECEASLKPGPWLRLAERRAEASFQAYQARLAKSSKKQLTLAKICAKKGHPELKASVNELKKWPREEDPDFEDEIRDKVSKLLQKAARDMLVQCDGLISIAEVVSDLEGLDPDVGRDARDIRAELIGYGDRGADIVKNELDTLGPREIASLVKMVSDQAKLFDRLAVNLP